MSGKSVVLACLSLAGVVIVGYVNTHTDEVTVVVSSVLIFTAGLGMAQPRSAWRWALLIGLAAPVSQLIAYLLHVRVPYPNDWPDVGTSLVTMLPAAIGTYVGAGFRLLLSAARTPDSSAR